MRTVFLAAWMAMCFLPAVAADEKSVHNVDPKVLDLITTRLDEEAVAARKYVAGFNELQVKLHAAKVARVPTAEDVQAGALVFKTQGRKEVAVAKSVDELRRSKAVLRAYEAGVVDWEAPLLGSELAVGRVGIADTCSPGKWRGYGLELMERADPRTFNASVQQDGDPQPIDVFVEGLDASDLEHGRLRFYQAVYVVVGTREHKPTEAGAEVETRFVLRPIHHGLYAAALQKAFLEAAPAPSTTRQPKVQAVAP